jgi:hypothetical protein
MDTLQGIVTRNLGEHDRKKAFNDDCQSVEGLQKRRPNCSQPFERLLTDKHCKLIGYIIHTRKTASTAKESVHHACARLRSNRTSVGRITRRSPYIPTPPSHVKMLNCNNLIQTARLGTAAIYLTNHVSSTEVQCAVMCYNANLTGSRVSTPCTCSHTSTNWMDDNMHSLCTH